VRQVPVSPRDRILEIADQLFYGHGIRAVGVDTIVAQSGAAKTTLYAHFGSKDELVAAYLRGRGERWRSYLAAELERRGGSPLQRLRTVFDVLGESCADPSFRGCPFINATAELAEPRHPARLAARDQRTWVHALFRDLAAAAGCDEPAEVGAELQLLYDAVLVTAQFEPGADTAMRARAAAEVLLRNHLEVDDA
jgi:AcrR family transcriptional regulator